MTSSRRYPFSYLPTKDVGRRRRAATARLGQAGSLAHAAEPF